MWEEFEAHEAELAELQELAEEQAAEQADAELVRGVVREWVEAHPESFTPDDVRILAMRARKLSYWLIAATLWPSADEDGCRRAHDRARARGSRARKRLPEHVAEYLPPNTRGEVNDKQGTSLPARTSGQSISYGCSARPRSRMTAALRCASRATSG